jgi:uncharacterized membrane protein
LAGKSIKVDFKVISVQRDGNDEDFHTEKISNGVRVYFGNADVNVDQGEHTYVFLYKTNRQIGFFEDHDELYWNVTGNGWVFPIEKVTANVFLPDGIDSKNIKLAGYTGEQGATNSDFNSSLERGGATFVSTIPLKKEEGLTVVVVWPKGFVAPPSSEQKMLEMLQENMGAIVGIAGIIIILFYYVRVWHRIGRDPKKGAIIAQYDPPRNLSPSALSYVSKRGYSNETFVSAILSLAVKGNLVIKENENKYELQKIDTARKIFANDEEVVFEKLFNNRVSLELEQANHSILSSAITALKNELKNNLGNYFKWNLGYISFGIFLSLLFFIPTAAFFASLSDRLGFFSMWLSIWTIGVIAISAGVFSAWKKTNAGIMAKFVASAITLFAVPFWFAQIFVLALVYKESPIFLFIFLLFWVINIVFVLLLPSRTSDGRMLMDEIEGFRLFLSVTEKDRLNFHNPPGKTPELFEKFLPYALALGVEHKWAAQFAEMFAGLSARGTGYSPTWYAGNNFNALNMSSTIASFSNSFSGAISSSSMAPGSSSGLSGGSSGGGGGGGGGGGW